MYNSVNFCHVNVSPKSPQKLHTVTVYQGCCIVAVP